MFLSSPVAIGYTVTQTPHKTSIIKACKGGNGVVFCVACRHHLPSVLLYVLMQASDLSPYSISNFGNPLTIFRVSKLTVITRWNSSKG